MENLKLCESDYRFMLVVWENEPVESGQLVKLCADKLGWKKSTTYTVLRKMQEKGLLKNE
ncbi:MAG: BlaI/MecI/CopY family transcriptional regulator, partial [Eubacteriales bacterium]|nr:BlaI/MecI/CopY family transcriptional regulator [Eubacteriales bacterium]MDD3073292.1 BlaI/MecI/CopY family transcriptional regulator [Eubacteriales bacterium]